MPYSCPMSGWFCLIPIAVFGIMFVLFLVFARRRKCFFWATTPDSAGSSSETPIEIIKRRYAKGEISREQFEQMKQELKN